MNKSEKKNFLHQSCEQAVSALRELISIHFTIDPPTREVSDITTEVELRMRKILLHVNAIKCREIDLKFMHVLAPEVRSAHEQISYIIKDCFANKKEIIECITHAKEKLSPYIHPAPQVLLLPRELGGLGQGDDLRYYRIIFGHLMCLVCGYGYSLRWLSNSLDAGMEAHIDSVLAEFGNVCAEVNTAVSESRVVHGHNP